MISKNNSLRRYTELPYLIDFLSTGEIFLPSPKSWDDRNDSFYLERYAELLNLSNTYALCLTEAPETYHHWSIFSSGSSGVCIVFDKKLFLESISHVVGLRAETVRYKTISEMKNTNLLSKDLPFIKRYPYRDECEFRVFIAPEENIDGGVRVSVPKRTINKIILSPWLSKNVVKQVRNSLKAIKGCSNIRIYGSTLVENDEWKTFSSTAM